MVISVTKYTEQSQVSDVFQEKVLGITLLQA